MPLPAGARLGPFEILSALGAGGMGEVYRARDPKLNRDVALKVLPELFALDADRLARFTREAQVLASLNHPNIGAIYGLEESDPPPGSGRGAVQALVLELVEGPTLADRIASGPIPVDEALPIARQIAEALEAAHEQGIVHRDLKPANIVLKGAWGPTPTREKTAASSVDSPPRLTDQVVVKVLDFGLAKALEPMAVTRPDVTASPTITTPAMTQMGMILGTAAYMSPEQAKGRQADKRSDVWAFGAVLYEMLSGQRAFKGDDIADTLAAVLRQDIDLTALPASTPEPLRRLIMRCLDRDIRRRLRDIGEARIVLEDPVALVRADPTGGPYFSPPRPLWQRAIPVVLSAIVAAVLAGTAAWYFALSSLIPPAVTRLPLALPEGQSLTAPASRHALALSPDGTQLVYRANAQLYIRSMTELEPHAVQGTDGFRAVDDPVFSPDGRSILFYAAEDETLKRVAVTGGAAVTVGPAALTYGINWGPDGIVFGQGSKGIMRVSPNGGPPDVLVRVNEGEEAHGPQLLPGGQQVLFTLATGSALDRWDKAQIVVQSLASGERKTLVEGGTDARYAPTGHLVYARGGRVFALPFDVRRLEVKGGPVLVIDSVSRSAGSTTGAAQFSFSSTGSLVYISGLGDQLRSQMEMVVTDRKGGIERLKLPHVPLTTAPRVSPDGTRIAFDTDDGKEAIVWIYNLSGTSPMRRLTFGGNNRTPIWTADSQRVTFQSDRDGGLAIFWQHADGTGTAERLTKPDRGESHAPESWSPKADALLFSITKGTDVSLWTFSLKDRKLTPYGEVHSSVPTGARFSPDGRWVAYASGERGPTTIYVQPFPATGAKYQLVVKGSNNTPHKAAWSPDGKELFYVPRLGAFEAVSVTTQPTFTFGNAVEVPRPFNPGPPNSRTLYDITPSGKFVGMVIPGSSDSTVRPSARQMQIVLNWFTELQQRVPTR